MGLLVFFSIATLLLTPSSYNFAPVVFTVLALVKIIKQSFFKNNRNEECSSNLSLSIDYFYQRKWLKYTTAALVIYLLVFILYRFLMHGHNNEMDNPSRALLFLPLLWYPFSFNLKGLLDKIFIGSAIGGVIACFVASYGKWVLHAERAFPDKYMYIQAGDMSMSLALFALVGMIWMLQKKNHFKLGIMFVGFLGGVFASVISGSRGGWLILLPVLIWLVIASRTLVGKKALSVVVVTLLIVIIGVIVAPHSEVEKRYNEAIMNIVQYQEDNPNTSVGQRIDMWKSAWIAIQGKPIVGWGVQGMTQKKEDLIRRHIVSPEIRQFTHVHNQYLNDWAERGILGLLSLLSIFIVPFIVCVRYIRKAIKGSPQYVMAVLGAIHILAVASYGLSQGFLEHNSGNMFYFFILSLFMGLLLHSREKE